MMHPDCPIAWQGVSNVGQFDGDTIRYQRADSVEIHPSEIAALVKIVEGRAPLHETLLDCILAWPEGGTEISDENRVFLHMAWSVLHLSAIFLHLSKPELSADSIPGAATAAFVRYLRCHFIFPKRDFLTDEPLQQPEHDPDYWDSVYALVASGRMEDACLCLQQHSLIRQSTEDPALHDVGQYFEEFRAFLLLAPIPGGRNTANDADLPWTERMADAETFSLPLRGLDIMGTDYKYWDHPDSESFKLALRKFQNWKQYAIIMREHFALARRIPQLDNILAICAGNLALVPFAGWADRLCAELILVQPDLPAKDLSKRARKIMTEYGLDVTKHPYPGVLGIMEGDAGTALEHLHVYGGGSAAALPSTILALEYNDLLVRGIVRTTDGGRLSEFLATAAWNIVGSMENDCDAGADLAVRLLMPFVSDGNIDLLSNLCRIVDRYSPSSMLHMDRMLDLCRPLVERKSIQALESCRSMIMSRFLNARRNHRCNEQITCLLSGVRLESLIYDEPRTGLCWLHLSRVCLELSNALLSLVSTSVERVDSDIDDEDMKRDSQQVLDTLDDSMITWKFTPKLVLSHCLRIYDASCNPTSDLSDSARSIVELLRNQNLATEGTRRLASCHMQWALLSIATSIIEEEHEDDDTTTHATVFSPDDIGVLMDAMVMLLARTRGVKEIPSGSTIEKMKNVLTRGIAPAYVTENSKRQTSPTTFTVSLTDEWDTPVPKKGTDDYSIDEIRRIRVCDLHMYPLHVQDQVLMEMMT